MKGGLTDARTHSRRVAISEQDYLRAQLREFRYRVDRALRVIGQARAHGRIAISFSGGKDSTVLLDLVRRVAPDSVAGFWDSGAELQSTYDLVAHYGVEMVQPKMSFPEMCRYGGWWGHPNPVEKGKRFPYDKILIHEPSRRFCEKHQCSVVAVGLRADESGVREIRARQHGELDWIDRSETWMLCPLTWWTTDDIWAYIASRNLRYNAAYDQMAEMGVPRREQRISTLLDKTAATTGRFAVLKRLDPGLWNQLVIDFPNLRRFA